jgi:RimJ/RimL family protein N-acetyltransferase
MSSTSPASLSSLGRDRGTAGSLVVCAAIRPIRPSDRGRLLALFDRLSAETRYRRFHGYKAALSQRELTRLVEVDHRDHVALVAAGPGGDLCGVTRFVRDAERPHRADTAIVVADAVQGQGLGARLLGALLDEAARVGVTELSLQIQHDNRAMLALARRFAWRRAGRDRETVELVLDVPARSAADRGSAGGPTALAA